MHDEGLECPIRIIDSKSGHSLDALKLLQLSQQQRTLPVRLTNEFNESRAIEFIQNKDAIVTKGSIESKRQSSALGSLKVCHYEGVSEAGEHSALSVCSLHQISGILTINGRKFVLDVKVNGSFVLLPQQSNRCDWNEKIERAKRDRSSSAKGVGGTRTAEYYSEFLDGRWRYVELALIADYSVYVKYEKNTTEVQERLSTLANFVNSLYQPLNIRVVLVWADVWTETNPIEVISNSDKTLSNFLEYRKKLIKPHPHDNAHLLTNVHFDNNIVGKAYKGTMCSFDYSGGVDNDHSDKAAFVAATIAHEMGHNFGMEHDSSYTDCKCPSRGCIMAPSTGITPPTFWSDCSLRYLQHSLKRGADYCLQNAPEGAFGGARCGNGLVEAGEECDCGTVSLCTSKCCNAETCKLVDGAQCASGECCDSQTCQVKKATIICRHATNSCDLPEYCDGQMEHCPADFFVQDGLKCPDDPTDFCYDGKCGNRDQQCRFIWGSTGSNAAKECYQLNIHGSSSGNCGYDQITNQFATCDKRDVECGRLHCNHENEKLAFGDPTSVYSAYTALRLSSGEEVACRVIWTKLVGGKRQPDPGMVPDGASCGASSDRMCVQSKCENRSDKVKLAPKCDPEGCNDAGICNNMGNCHCEPGYGGISCAIPGPGGSVNSGPASEGSVIHVGYVVFWLLLLSAIVFILASIFVKRKKNIWLHKQIWHHLKEVLKLHRLLVPVRKAPAPPGPPIRTAELNAVWGDNPSDVLRRSTNSKTNNARLHSQPSPPPFSPPVIPSASFSHSTNNNNNNFLARNTSQRPKNAPPKIPVRPDTDVLNALYAEHNDELHYAVPPAYDYRPKVDHNNSDSNKWNNPSKKPQVNQVESTINRPVKAPPPPPPAHRKPPPGYDQVSNCVEEGEVVESERKKRAAKPRPPTKPVIVGNSNGKSSMVKNIAAKFDSKSAKLSTNFL